MSDVLAVRIQPALFSCVRRDLTKAFLGFIIKHRFEGYGTQICRRCGTVKE